MLLSCASKFYRQVAALSLSSFTRRHLNTMVRVSVNEGELEGTLEQLPSGGTYNSFKGIPYAAPPVGKLRFKAPQPPVKWHGIRDASNHGNVCPHVDIITGATIDGSDDCLFLNVYTPSVTKSSLPVMVWIHGGGFYCGSGDSLVYGPEYLVEEGVILVTINYRLEALGFLCLDTEDVPGNAGLKDQVAALKWVKNNIERFGGDPKNITVFGESAGGVSATYHMISSMSKGLINKVIAQSGCFLNEWAITSGGRERAFRLGKYLGKETNDENELLEYLQSLPVDRLCKVTFPTITQSEKERGLPICFGPIIEKFNNIDTFHNASPKELLQKSDLRSLPILLGYTDMEGIILCGDTLKKCETFDKHFDRKIPKEIVDAVSSETLKKIVDKTKKYYFGDKPLSKETKLEIVDFETDCAFSVPIIRFAEILANYSVPTYLYKFSVDSDANIVKRTLAKFSSMKGACHADDIFYIFKTPMDIEEGSESWHAMKRTVRIWTNFAKHGDPTPTVDDLLKAKWLPVESNKLNFLEICTDKLIPGVDPDKERFDLWKNIRQMASMDGLKSKI